MDYKISLYLDDIRIASKIVDLPSDKLLGTTHGATGIKKNSDEKKSVVCDFIIKWRLLDTKKNQLLMKDL